MDDFLEVLRLAHKHGRITKQQLKTLRGQALNGNLEGAHKGLKRLLGKEQTRVKSFSAERKDE